MQTYMYKSEQTVQVIHYRYSHLHFKSEMGISSGYIYVCFFSQRTYTLIIQTFAREVRPGRGGGVAKIDKISTLTTDVTHTAA